jgi:hypothetical protein
MFDKVVVKGEPRCDVSYRGTFLNISASRILHLVQQHNRVVHCSTYKHTRQNCTPSGPFNLGRTYVTQSQVWTTI